MAVAHGADQPDLTNSFQVHASSKYRTKLISFQVEYANVSYVVLWLRSDLLDARASSGLVLGLPRLSYR